VQALFRDLLIGVTSFFRDPEASRFSATRSSPRSWPGKETGGAIRVWGAGLHLGGKRPSSLAILLAEARERLGKAVNIQVFATDIDSEAIARARQGEIPGKHRRGCLTGAPQALFTLKVMSINSSKRSGTCLVFAVQDLISDPPFSKLDLISCRNLLIYMGAELQKKIIPVFHFMLNQGAICFWGLPRASGALPTCSGPWTPSGRFTGARPGAGPADGLPAAVRPGRPVGCAPTDPAAGSGRDPGARCPGEDHPGPLRPALRAQSTTTTTSSISRAPPTGFWPRPSASPVTTC